MPLATSVPLNTSDQELTYCMALTCHQSLAAYLADRIWEHYTPLCTATSYFEALPAASSSPDQNWCLQAYFSELPDPEALQHFIKEASETKIDSSPTFQRLSKRDWILESQAQRPALRLGRFFIHDSYEKHKVRPHQRALHIEAGLAFGTGYHGTTYGCLQLLEYFAQQFGNRLPNRAPLLDIGTGSGILALAAAQVWRKPVLAIDHDPVAVRTARHNVQCNGLQPWVRTHLTPHLQDPLVTSLGPYPLIFANLIEKTLHDLALPILALMGENSYLILSGLLISEARAILSLYCAHHCTLLQEKQKDGWTSLLLRHHAPHKHRKV